MKKLLLLPIIVAPILGGCFFLPITEHEDIENYEKYLKDARDLSDFHTELYIFPETVNKDNVSQFRYSSRDDLFTGSYFFYLVTTYSQVDFNAELTRLSLISAVFQEKETVKPIIYNVESSYFLTIYRNSRYEYAIYNAKDFEIAYVSNQLFGWDETCIRDDRYMLPDEVKIPEKLDDGDNSYNMYYLFEEDIGYYVED